MKKVGVINRAAHYYPLFMTVMVYKVFERYEIAPVASINDI